MKKDNIEYRGIYEEMVDILGEEIVKIIHKHYKGQQLNLPMKLHSNEYVKKYIIEKHDKKNIRELSRELGYSDRWIKKLIEETVPKE